MNEILPHPATRGARGARGRLRPLLPRGAALALLCALAAAGCGGQGPSVTLLTLPLAAGTETCDPSVRIDPRDRSVIVTWLGTEGGRSRIWFSRSRDRGATWSAPVAVTRPGEPLRPYGEASPRLACDAEGRVAVVWSTAEEIPGSDALASDVRFARSLDGGATWSLPVTLNDDDARGPGTHTFQDMAATESGSIAVAWLDSRPGGDGAPRDTTEGTDASVHYVFSQDFGDRWSGNSAQWSRACPGCRVAVSMEFTGTVFIAFRRHYPGQVRDVVVGRPDGPLVRVFADRWQKTDCEAAGPALRVPRDHTLRMAWSTGAAGRAGVWFRHAFPETYDSTVTPMPIVTGDHASAAHVSLGTAGPFGTLLACDADSIAAGRLTLVRVEASGRRIAERHTPPGIEGASRPQVAASNRDRDAYVVWTEQRDGRDQVHMLRWRLGR